MREYTEFKDKIAVVTGGAEGIGSAISLEIDQEKRKGKCDPKAGI